MSLFVNGIFNIGESTKRRNCQPRAASSTVNPAYEIEADNLEGWCLKYWKWYFMNGWVTTQFIYYQFTNHIMKNIITCIIIGYGFISAIAL